jgi:hypothetical protein
MPDVENINVGIMFAGVSPLQTTAIFCLAIGISFENQIVFSVKAYALTELITIFKFYEKSVSIDQHDL